MFASFHARALGLSIAPDRLLDLAAGAGFEGLDLLVRDLVESGVDLGAFRDRMAGLGLKPGAWPLPVDWRGPESRFRADLAALPHLAEAAATLGLSRSATRVMTETPGRPESDPDRRAEIARTFDLHVDRIGAAARVLADHGSRLGLEVVGVESFRTGSGWPFYSRLGDLGPLLDALDAESEGGNVGLLVDVFHLHASGEPISAALSRGVDRVVWVHLADLPADFGGDRASIRDGDRALPGEGGLVDSRALLALLSGAGYDGPVTAEPLAGCRSLVGLPPEAVARRARLSIRNVWP